MAEMSDTPSPLFGPRYEIEVLLKVLSPLHVGTGESDEIKGVGGREGANAEKPGVARIVADWKGEPYLPATTIKGMLRRIAEETRFPGAEDAPHVVDKFRKLNPANQGTVPKDFADNVVVEELFGTIKGEKSGAMGALLPRGASLKEAGSVADYPYVEAVKKAGSKLAKGAFVAARTAIDPLSGVAADAKLYFQEMVAPGAKFELRLTLLAGANGETRRENLLKILAALTAAEGIVCGRGKSDGAGALQLLEKSLQVFERRIDSDGILGKEEISVELPKAETIKPWTGVFHCEGPFLSLDSSWDPEREKKELGEKDQDKVPQLSYQSGQDGQPLELGSQVAGALRARARWIMGLKALRLGVDPKLVDPGAGDDTKEKERVVRSPKDVTRLDLTPVERLFGVSGFAGLLRIEKMRLGGGKEIDIASVKLDHFSGAPIDKALFKTRAMTGVWLELSLSLRGRKDADPNKRTEAATPAKQDEELFEDLVKDLEDKGKVLMLGHGTNKGFGWFEYKGSGGDVGR